MRYGWDKIKVVTDNLKKWDRLEALSFDTCWYLLIWKWTNDYWTRWDPLMSDDVPCWSEWRCPACQPLITDVRDLPWRPEPCNSWDAFLMMQQDWTLFTMCKSSFQCEDKKVAVSDWDEIPWYLAQKLTICDSNSPLSLTEKASWSSHKLCIWWDPSKANLKFIDLKDTPSSYESPWLLFSDWDWISMMKPKACEWYDYSYLVYRKWWSFDTMCPVDSSVATLILNSDYNFTVMAGATYANHIEMNKADITLKSTSDIKKWSSWTLFTITRPWIYMLTSNATIMNDDQAWMKAVRWWLTVNGSELAWAKFDSRNGSEYINEHYPDEYEYHWWARESDLWIASLNTSYIHVFDESDVPANIWFFVKIDCRVQWDLRWVYDESNRRIQPEWWLVHFHITSWVSEEWPRMFIWAVRIWEIPKTYKVR